MSVWRGRRCASLALRRRGWRETGVIDAGSRDEAEIRLFAGAEPAAASPTPHAAVPRSRRQDSSGRGRRSACSTTPEGEQVRVAIIDYGSGNLRSAAKAFERAARQAGVTAEIELTADAEAVRRADRIVLPGVGAYAACASGLAAVPGMREAIEEVACIAARPFLGICVGMQLMAERGLEKAVTRGFGWIAGDVREIAPSDPALKIPQIGWNTIHVKHRHPLFAGIPTGDEGLHAYFVHSYHLEARDDGDVLAIADYGGPVTAAVAKGNLAGTQFHPEKSQALGLALIANFLKWRP